MLEIAMLSPYRMDHIIWAMRRLWVQPIYIPNINVAGNLTLKVVNKSYFFNSSYKTYVNGLCFEASATS